MFITLEQILILGGAFEREGAWERGDAREGMNWRYDMDRKKDNEVYQLPGVVLIALSGRF